MWWRKESIAVDGISLTVAGVNRNWFRIWIIPHTREVTNLRACREGDLVNLEADILGKYVDQLMGKRAGRGVDTLCAALYTNYECHVASC